MNPSSDIDLFTTTFAVSRTRVAHHTPSKNLRGLSSRLQ